MTINVYTFEQLQGSSSGQIRPYSASVDARVRRDLFRQKGDLIIVGNRDGWINKNPQGDVTNQLTFQINNSVTFVAGGRLFTVTNENITLSAINLRTFNQITIGVYEINFDINTNATDGNFIRRVTNPSYSLAYNDPNVWELSQFSVSYKLVAVGVNGGVFIYPAPEFNGTFAAGTSSMMTKVGDTMNGSSPIWRGSMLQSSTCVLTQSGPNINDVSESVFTLLGDIGTVVESNTAGTILLGLKDPRCPYRFITGDENRNKVVLNTNIGVLQGTIRGTNEASDYLFAASNLTLNGAPANIGSINRANIFGSFVASWGYWT